MEVSKRSIKEIFGADQHIIVPLYQRPCVWTRDQQWEPLRNDIRNLFPHRKPARIASKGLFREEKIDLAEYGGQCRELRSQPRLGVDS
jgi:hypothetical protein